MGLSAIGMEIVINNIQYNSLDAMAGTVAPAVISFLREWYDDKPYVMGHTSGSTGEPKPVQLLKTDMRASAQLTNAHLGIDAASTLLLCLSPSYIAGKMMIVRALEARARLCVVEPSSQPLSQVNEAVTLAAMIPMQVIEMLKLADGAARLSQVKHLLVGGAPVNEQLEAQLKQLSSHIYITYGMTETVSHVALRAVGEPLYTALGDVTFECDSRGCLVIDAPQLSDRRYVTNDIVELADAKHFAWVGRFDNVIISGGLKYSAERLERKLEHCIAERYYIVGCPDEVLGERIVLCIEAVPYDAEKMSQLQQAMAERLTRYELPREVQFLAQFEMTATGKVKRKYPL